MELNATLFAACKAEQTAAAGSLATNNLSAFTYALTTQLDPAVSLNDLCSMVVQRLLELNMSQTPQYYVPADNEQLAQLTFIDEQPATHGPNQKDFMASSTRTNGGAAKAINIMNSGPINRAISSAIEGLRKETVH